MKKGLLVVLLLSSLIGLGQCPGVNITTQSEIDNFVATYPDCTEFEFIRIAGMLSDITSLNGLNQIEIIANDFAVENTEIIDFSGMENLTSIGADLFVLGNESLVNFNGLINLEMIGTAFTSFGNISQIDYSGLSSLTHIATAGAYYGFQSAYNTSLQSFHGLENVVDIDGSFFVVGNDLLVNLQGFDQLISIGGTFGINDNQNLIDLTGINNLLFIGRQFQITDNANILTLNGLENLENFGISENNNFFIFGNANLASIDALNNMDLSIVETIDIYDNPNLSNCAINSICNELDNNLISFFIQNNNTNCNSIAEIEDQCQLYINEEDFLKSVSVFPNPVTLTLNIEISNTIFFEKAIVYSTLGQRIFETSEKEINMENLSAGVYFVEVVTDKGSVTKKIVKE